MTKKQQLHFLLRSLLHTKLLLLDALGKPPRPAAELSAAGLSSEGEQVGCPVRVAAQELMGEWYGQYIQHMTELASGMTVIANELRPVQVSCRRLSGSPAETRRVAGGRDPRAYAPDSARPSASSDSRDEGVRADLDRIDEHKLMRRVLREQEMCGSCTAR